MIFNQHSQIYVSGWGEWFRVLDQTDTTVRLLPNEGSAQWHEKTKIVAQMDKDEPSFCTDGQW